MLVCGKTENANAQRGGKEVTKRGSKKGTVLKKPVFEWTWFKESSAAEVERWINVTAHMATKSQSTNRPMQLLDMWAWQMVSDAVLLFFGIFGDFPQIAKVCVFKVFRIWGKRKKAQKHMILLFGENHDFCKTNVFCVFLRFVEMRNMVFFAGLWVSATFVQNDRHSPNQYS